MGKGVGKEKEAITEAARLFKVKTIDFDKQMLIVVSAGDKPNSGYKVSLSGLSVESGKLKVAWKVIAPGKDDITLAVITNPGIVALVDRFAGKVVFDPPLPARKK
jgi:hypothetical protein